MSTFRFKQEDLEALKNEAVNDLNLPPALDVYKSKVSVVDDIVNYGLNMYFKKPHKASDDPQ